MLTEPKISIITACFNHGRYIGEMLQSVYCQTFQEFEVIIVNDGSTDNTSEILSSVTNGNVTVINTKNNGPALARNIAISHAKAPVIMNLDADDKIASDLLEKAYKIFTENENAGIVHCDAECFGARVGKFEIGDYSINNMLYSNRINSQSFFKREDWEKVGGYSDELIYGMEDWDFWLLLIELGRDVIKIPESLVFYRTYKSLPESRSGRRKTDRLKARESQLIIFQRHKNLYAAYPDAIRYFSSLEDKISGENFAVRQIKNLFFKYSQKYYWKFAGKNFFKIIRKLR